MTRIAYLDCFAGISGDMFLGALLDVGWPLVALQDVVAKLNLAGLEVQVEHVHKQSIYATQVRVISPPQQPQRGYRDLEAIVLQGDFSSEIQEQTLLALKLLAEAESDVHHVPVERIHFHEVGAVDTLVDIVGAMAGLRELDVETVHCAALPWSHGTVKTAHGILPVPPPAVAVLLQGLPVVGADVYGEMVTPTGATLVRALAKNFGPVPPMRVERIGYGAGQREWPDRPNLLRLVIGQDDTNVKGLIAEMLTVLACNIDDMNPQWYGLLVETLLQANALDVWLTPAQMKKNRPATVIEVLCKAPAVDALRDLLLRHTTTLGVRQYTVTRYSVERRIETVQTPYGPVRVKIASLPNGTEKAAPEHDDCMARAQEHNTTIREVWLAALRAHGDQTLMGD